MGTQASPEHELTRPSGDEMTTETNVSKQDLEKAVTEAETLLSEKQAAARKALTEQAASENPDFNIVSAASGEAKRAETALAEARKAVKDFEANESWATLRGATRPIFDILTPLQANPITVPATRITGTITIGDDGNVSVSSVVMLSKPDTAALEEAIKQAVMAHRADFQKAQHKEMTFIVPDLGKTENPDAVSIGPKTLVGGAAKTPKPAASNGSGTGTAKTYAGMGAAAYIQHVLDTDPATVAQHAKSFENFKENGSKMNGLSNLAGVVAAKRGDTIA